MLSRSTPPLPLPLPPAPSSEAYDLAIEWFERLHGDGWGPEITAADRLRYSAAFAEVIEYGRTLRRARYGAPDPYLTHTNVFVYGTLMPRGANHGFIFDGLPVRAIPAYVSGSLFMVPRAGFPAYVTAGVQRVPGYLLDLSAVRDLPSLWERLDDVEGVSDGLYLPQIVTAHTRGGPVETIAYVWQGDTDGMRRIHAFAGAPDLAEVFA